MYALAVAADRLLAGTERGLAESRDHATTWRWLPAPTGRVFLVENDPAQPARVYLGTDQGLLAGTPPELRPVSGLPAGRVRQLGWRSAGALAFVLLDRRVYVPGSSAEAWRALPNPTDAPGLDAATVLPSGDLLATSGPEVWRRGGPGEAWTHLGVLSGTPASPRQAYRLLVAGDPPRIFAATDQGLIASADGRAWTDAGQRLPAHLSASTLRWQAHVPGSVSTGALYAGFTTVPYPLLVGDTGVPGRAHTIWQLGLALGAVLLVGALLIVGLAFIAKRRPRADARIANRVAEGG